MRAGTWGRRTDQVGLGCFPSRGDVMPGVKTYTLNAIGFVRSGLKSRRKAPKQGNEGAPDAWLEMGSSVAKGLEGVHAGEEIIVITWFHQARRDVLKLHPRGD